MRVYITGADGSLGTAFVSALSTTRETAQWTVRCVSIGDFDIGDRAAFRASVDAFEPDLVVHLAAIAMVADCETDPDRALRVNVAGVRHAAEAARRHGARLVYLSSDYVFDGDEPPQGGYRETDVPNPLSVYALTKLAGEHIAGTVPEHLVVRTSWLFGGASENNDDVLASVHQARRGQRAQLLADQYARPTYTVDLATALVHLITTGATGTVHAVGGGGAATRYELGLFAVRAFDPELAEDYAPAALAFDDCTFVGRRPRYSALNTDRLAGLGFRMPHWQDGVTRFCADLRGGLTTGTR